MRLITGNMPILASQDVEWKYLNIEKNNKEYFDRLSEHSLEDKHIIKGIPVYHSYLGKGKEHEYFALDFEKKRVLYYCLIAPSSERSIFKASLRPVAEKLVWRDSKLLKSFAAEVFFKVIFPSVKSCIISDEEQSSLGLFFWIKLSEMAVRSGYTVMLFGVDNKSNRRVYNLQLNDFDEEFMLNSEDLVSYMHGADIVFRHRGILISKISDVLRSDAKHLTIYDSLSEFVKYEK